MAACTTHYTASVTIAHRVHAFAVADTGERGEALGPCPRVVKPGTTCTEGDLRTQETRDGLCTDIVVAADERVVWCTQSSSTESQTGWIISGFLMLSIVAFIVGVASGNIAIHKG